MLKVFLVEDEFVVREGIKNNINWEANGYEFCGEASDGELAYPMIQELKPDIVITDIRMPFMDGLELSRLIKKEMPWMEIIVLTGYEEFEYAKECIKIGVAEYLTKPISSEMLLEELGVIAKDIEEKRKERESREKYQKEMEENYQQEGRNLFQYIVTGSKSVAELLEIADRIHVDISSVWYNVVLVQIQSVNQQEEEDAGSIMEIEQKLLKLRDDEHFLVFDRTMEGKAVLFKGDTREELLQVQTTHINQVKEVLNHYADIRYFGGIGTPVNRLREVPLSFEKASRAYLHRYLVKENLILSEEDTEKKGAPEKEVFNINSVDSKVIDRSKIREFLQTGEEEEAVLFVEAYFKALGKAALNSRLFRQYIILDTYFCVADFLESMSFQRGEIEVFGIDSDATQSPEGARDYLVRIMKQAFRLREKTASNRYNGIVEQVIHYIEENYADEDLSLNMLAEQVSFSPNHLSMIFSQQTGQTFIKYLTDYRMSKAKELLRWTGKRSGEISAAVGYKDPHYFSYLFKKTQGMTPTQYRSGKKAEGDA
jgi:two-component system response regulator YesN